MCVSDVILGMPCNLLQQFSGLLTVDRAPKSVSAICAFSSRQGDWTCLVYIRFNVPLSRKLSVQQ